MASDELNEIKKVLDDFGSRIEKLEGRVFASEPSEPKGQQSGAGVDVDVRSLSYLKELKSALDKCLAILDHLFSKDPNHTGLTPDEFTLMFKVKFGLPVPLSTISSQLYKETGRYVTRKKVAGQPVKYRYQILPRGQEYIRNKIARLQGEAHA